jgi:hypothetical protein
MGFVEADLQAGGLGLVFYVSKSRTVRKPVENRKREAGFNAWRISRGSGENAGLKPDPYKGGEEATENRPKNKNAPTRVGA